jgi:hypothetical protein
MLLFSLIIMFLSIILNIYVLLHNRKRSILLSVFKIYYVCTTFRLISHYSAADIKFPSCIRFISDTSTRDEAFSSEDDTDTTELSSIDDLFL